MSCDELLSKVTALCNTKQEPIFCQIDEDTMMPIAPPKFAQLPKLLPDFQQLVDMRGGLAKKSEDSCSVSLGDATFLFKITNNEGAPVASAMTNKIHVRVNNILKDIPVSRCEVRIEDVVMPTGWADMPLKATVAVINDKRATAFYVMNGLEASTESMTVPDMTRVTRLGGFSDFPDMAFPGNEIEGDDLGKTDRISFGAEQQAVLISDPDYEFGNFAVLNLIKGANATTATFALSLVNANQAGIFAIHEPHDIIELLTKRNILGGESSKAGGNSKGAKRARK